jgi:poly(hydroxyalkanoate) granule-associated protein
MAIRKTGKLKGSGSRQARAKARPKARASDQTTADAVHQIWLAGMGALARAQAEGPKAFEKLIKDGSQFIDQGRSNAGHLLGEALASAQATVGARVAATRESAAGTWRDIEQLFQDRVEKVLHQSGIPTAAEIRGLAKRIDLLSTHVEALAAGKPKARAAKPKARAKRKSGATAGPATG